LLSCESQEPRVPLGTVPEVLDSAGIRIVYSPEPTFLDGQFWTLGSRPTVRIDGMDGGDSNVLLDPGTAYRAPDGRIIVADGLYAGWNEVLVFNRRGRYLESFGREGRGPCEFRQLWWVGPYRGDSIAAYDYSDHVVAILGPNGECGREVRLPVLDREHHPGTYGYSPGLDGVFDDGWFVAYSDGAVDVGQGAGEKWYRHFLLRVHPEGSVWDTLGEFGFSQVRWTGTESQELPFGALIHPAVGPRGFFFGDGQAFEVREYDRQGSLQMIIRWSGEREPVTDDDIAEFEEWARSRNSAS